MKNLVIGSLVAAALSQAAGCIFVTDSNNDALLSTSWEIRNFVGNQSTACPVGFNTAAVISQPVDSLNRPIGAPFTDLFDCEARGGVVSLPPGPFEISIEIQSGGGGAFYAESVPAIIDLTFNDDSYSTTLYNDAGYIDVGWNFVGDTTNRALDCSNFLSDGVKAISTNVTTPTSMFTDKYNCSDLGGITDPLPEATYDVDVQAFRGTTVIGSATTIPNVEVAREPSILSLGTVTIRMTGL